MSFGERAKLGLQGNSFILQEDDLCPESFRKITTTKTVTENTWSSGRKMCPSHKYRQMGAVEERRNGTIIPYTLFELTQ